MIIHVWMHWFWITTVSFKGFLFFTIQMISISCIPNPSTAEAGLLDNETFTDHNLNIYEATNSSQVELITNVTSLPIENVQERTRSPEITSEIPSPSSPYEETDTEPTLKADEVSRFSSEGASDTEDTYNGGSLDVYQYPLKKFAKYSHIKYGKAKSKGKANEEPGGEERKMETLKIVEEKLNINFSVDGDSAGREVEPEIDKGNDTIAVGSTSEMPGEAVEAITSSPTIDNSTVDVGNGTEAANETFVSSTEEVLLKDEPPRTEVPSTATTEFLQNVTEIQKDLLFKNDSLVIENKVEESRAYTTVEPFLVKNRVAAATSAQNYEVNQSELNAGSITGITLGILVVFSLFGAVSFVLYRRRYLNKPQVLHDKCSNLDSSGYIDDTSLRENSEEMYSLDNDSFLNSLEAMTIQNYWTESVKHTKL